LIESARSTVGFAPDNAVKRALVSLLAASAKFGAAVNAMGSQNADRMSQLPYATYLRSEGAKPLVGDENGEKGLVSALGLEG
jgi:hypothetical protein